MKGNKENRRFNILVFRNQLSNEHLSRSVQQQTHPHFEIIVAHST